MTSDVLLPATRVLPLIAAAIAFLDTDAAFGSSDRRTLRAKSLLRTAVEGLGELERSRDPPRLHVIQGCRRS